MSYYKLATFLCFLSIGCSPLIAAPIPAPSTTEKIDVPVPVGIPVLGLKIPHYDKNGILSLLMESESAKKIDVSQIEMSNLKMQALDQDSNKIFVELPQSLFNLDSRILTGHKGALIKRSDFVITGDNIEFNTETRFGTIRGNVKMVISTENTLP
jgi:hypothetical protein